MGERLDGNTSDLQFYMMQDGGQFTPVIMNYETGMAWRPWRWIEPLSVTMDLPCSLDDSLSAEVADVMIRETRELIASSEGCEPEEVMLFCPAFRGQRT